MNLRGLIKTKKKLSQDNRSPSRDYAQRLSNTRTSLEIYRYINLLGAVVGAVPKNVPHTSVQQRLQHLYNFHTSCT
jgi:hypothetical protein